MTTALVLYGSTVTATTLANACKLSITTGGSSASNTTTCTDVSSSHYWYMEVLSKGGSNGDVATLPAPTGKGYLYDVIALEDQTILSGNWTATVRINDSVGFASVDLIIRAYIYNGGTYTAICTMTAAGVALNGTTTNYTTAASSTAAKTFRTGDKLYLDFFVFANGSGGHWDGDPIVNFTSSSGTAGIANQFVVTTPGYVPAIRTIPATIALQALNTTRTVASTVALLQTNGRTILATIALLQPNNIRTIPATIALSATIRTIPLSVALLQTNGRTILATIALLQPNNIRTIPSSVALAAIRTIPLSVALLQTNGRTILATIALLQTNGRTIPATIALLQTNSRTIPVIASLSTPPLLSGGVAVWASGTGTIQFDSFRATQYPDPSIFLSTTGRVGSSLTQWNAVIPTNTTLMVAISTDGITWTNVTNDSALPNVYAQPYPTIDTFVANTSTNYTNTSRTGGAVAVTTYDTTNSRLVLTSGTNGLYLNTVLSRADVDLFCTMDQSDSGGLIWRFVDQNNFYYLQVGDASSSISTNIFVLCKVTANVQTTLSTSAIQFTRGTYKTIRVTMVLGVITAYLDGNVILTYTDGSPLTAGQIGLYNNGGVIGSRYYQLRLQALGDDLSGEWLYSKVTMTTTDPSANPQLPDLLVTTRGPGLDPGVIIPQLRPASKPFAEYYSATFNALVTASANAGNDYFWNTDMNGVLTFTSRTTMPAPWCLSSADLLYTPTVQPTFAADLYRNRFTVSNCTGVTALQTETKIADGTTSSWTMAYPLYSTPIITVEGVAKTVGTQGIDTGKDFYWQLNSNSIGQDTTATKIVSGYILQFQYIGQFVTNITVNNLPEQAARAAVEIGTSGIVEAWEDGLGMLASNATVYAQGVLARYSNNNAVMIQATTLRGGLKVGQMLSTFIPEFNLNNIQLFITKITTIGQQQADGSVLYQYQIEATNGPSLNNWSSAWIGQ